MPSANCEPFLSPSNCCSARAAFSPADSRSTIPQSILSRTAERNGWPVRSNKLALPSIVIPLRYDQVFASRNRFPQKVGLESESPWSDEGQRVPSCL